MKQVDYRLNKFSPSGVMALTAPASKALSHHYVVSYHRMPALASCSRINNRLWDRSRISHDAALSTLPTSVCLDTQIHPGKRMPALAERFLGVNTGRTVRSQHINLVRNRLDVGRITANRPAAQMVGLKAFWDYPNKKLVRDQVGKSFTTLIAEHAVAMIIFVVLPFPARRTVVKINRAYSNLREKANKNFSIYGKSFRIGVSHSGFTSYVKFLSVRLGSVLQARFRAVFILSQTQTI